jgi:hypothetical protein
LASVEKVNPTARFAAMNTTSATDSNNRLPTIGTPNKSFAAARMMETWM